MFMEKKERKDLRQMIPEVYRKSRLVGSIGIVIGAAIGGFVSAITGNYIYTGIGVAIGYLFGFFIGLVIKEKINLQALKSFVSNIYLVVSILGFLLFIGSVVAFIKTAEWLGILGAVFFGLCSLYLFKKAKSTKI